MDQQLKSKAIDLGLERAIKKEEPASNAATSASNERNARLEALEAEKQSDLEAGMLLLGKFYLFIFHIMNCLIYRYTT